MRFNVGNPLRTTGKAVSARGKVLGEERRVLLERGKVFGAMGTAVPWRGKVVREVGKAAIEAFSELKTIYIDYSGALQNAQFVPRK